MVLLPRLPDEVCQRIYDMLDASNKYNMLLASSNTPFTTDTKGLVADLVEVYDNISNALIAVRDGFFFPGLQLQGDLAYGFALPAQDLYHQSVTRFWFSSIDRDVKSDLSVWLEQAGYDRENALSSWTEMNGEHQVVVQSAKTLGECRLDFHFYPRVRMDFTTYTAAILVFFTHERTGLVGSFVVFDTWAGWQDSEDESEDDQDSGNESADDVEFYLQRHFYAD
jgi:hypothetical protein